MKSMERKLFQAITTQFSNYLLENSIFSHFSLFVPAYGQPLDPISAFIDKNVITRCCCNDICKEKATPGYYHTTSYSIFLPFAWKFQFLVIFDHFSPFVPAHGWPLNPTSAFIDKNVITGSCSNEIYGKKATPGYFNPIFSSFAWKLNFLTFLAIFHYTICAYSWATPWSHLCFYWQKYYHWVPLERDLYWGMENTKSILILTILMHLHALS